MIPKKTLAQHNPPPAEDGVPCPCYVGRGEFVEAIRPLCDLLGLDPYAVLRDGFTVTGKEISLLTVTPIEGIEPQSSDPDDPGAIWVWPLEVPVLP